MPGPWDAPTPPPRKPLRLGVFIWLGILATAAGLLLVLSRFFPTGDSLLGDPGVVQTIGFLVLASSSLLFIRAFDLKRTVRNVVLWLGIGAVFMVGFLFRNELTDFGIRLRGALIPSYAIQTGAREMTLTEGEDGHYHVYGVIRGVKVYFLIDTGATDIVLDPEDARRIGLKLEELAFDKPFGSANGVGYGASVEIDALTVGAIRLSDVRMTVNKVRMGSSLLGMAFLKRLKSYSFSGGKLTMRW